MLEFALAGSFIFLPLLAGMSTIGFQMVRSLQVSTLTRDAGHMFSTGMDFSQAANQTVLQTIAGSSLSLSDGTGLLIFSEIDNTTSGLVASQYLVGAGSGSSKYVDPSGNLKGPASSISILPGQSVYIAEAYFTTPSGLLGGTSSIYSKAIF
jgi:hypothetical protein